MTPRFFCLISTYLLFLTLVYPSSAISQSEKKSKSGKVKIQGTLENIPGSVRYIYVSCMDPLKGLGYDSIKVVKNKYTYQTRVSIPTFITLFIRDPSFYKDYGTMYALTLFTGPASVTIVSRDSFSNATISGSAAHIEHQNFEERRRFSLLNYESVQAGMMGLHRTRDSVRIQRLAEKLDTAWNEQFGMYHEYLTANPSSPLRTYVSFLYGTRLHLKSPQQFVDETQEFYNRLSGREKMSFYGRRMKSNLETRGYVPHE